MPQRLALLAIFAFLFAGSARAQEAPTLAVRTDPARPFVAFGASVDAVGAIFGEYELRLDIGFSRHVGIVLAPGFHRQDDEMGPSLGAGVVFWPLGRGLDGWSISAIGEARWMRDGQHDGVDLGVTLESGYGFVWKGVYVGASAGARYRSRIGEGGAFGPVVRLLVGWSWV